MPSACSASPRMCATSGRPRRTRTLGEASSARALAAAAPPFSIAAESPSACVSDADVGVCGAFSGSASLSESAEGEDTPEPAPEGVSKASDPVTWNWSVRERVDGTRASAGVRRGAIHWMCSVSYIGEVSGPFVG